MGREGDFIWPGGVGADLFGEDNTARIMWKDRANDQLRTKFLIDYFKWHKENGRYHDSYDNDMFWIGANKSLTMFYALSGFAFGAIIFNPNYTSR